MDPLKRHLTVACATALFPLACGGGEAFSQAPAGSDQDGALLPDSAPQDTGPLKTDGPNTSDVIRSDAKEAAPSLDAPLDVTTQRYAEAAHDASRDGVAPMDASGEPAVSIDAGADDAEAGPVCNPVSYSFVAAADSVIVNGQCSGSINNGGAPYGNIGVGRAILRFRLDDPVAQAFFVAGKVKSMILTLARNASCEGDPNACAGTANTGVFQAFPLRDDWDEGTSAGYSGADWCRRVVHPATALWNQPGASGDHGNAAGSATVEWQVNTALIPLDAGQWDATWLNLNTSQLSVLVIAASGTFVYATRESAQYTHPALNIVICE
jgi:hypothetical protein